MKRMIAVFSCTLLLSLLSACGGNGNETSQAQSAANTAEENNGQEVQEKIKASQEAQKNEETSAYGEKGLEQIKEDLSASGLIENNIGTDDDYVISDIELIKRNTKEETDDVYVTVTFKGSAIQYTQDYKLTYNHYTTGGWILDDYEATSDLEGLPLAAVKDSVVISDVKNNSEYDYECEIVRHDTSMDDTSFISDMVEVAVTFDSNLVHSEGTLVCYYRFNGYGWELSEIDKNPANFDETLKVDGTWVCKADSDNPTGQYFVLQFWHGDDGKVYANWYNNILSHNKYTMVGDSKEKPCQFSFKEGTLTISALYYELDYDNIYDVTYGRIAFEHISDSILSEEKIEKNVRQSKSSAVSVKDSGTSSGGNAQEYLCEWSNEFEIDSSSWIDLQQEISESGVQLPSGKTVAQMIVNEIYARHGYTFKSEELQRYFGNKSWYSPTTSDMDKITNELNSTEKANVNFLQSVK